jgi:Cu(I)/Ag(I) efflux system membrane fusion protein
MIRRTTYVLVLLAVAAGAFLTGTRYHHPRETVTAAEAVARQPLYFHCPMHPAYKSDRPGTGPCCGMALVPVYAGSATAVAAGPPGAVTVSAEQQQLIGVRVATVERHAGTRQLRLFGRVAPDETRVYKLSVGLGGYIRDISPVTTGTQVRKDQWLASFSTPDARQPIGAYLQSLDVLDRERKIAASPQQVAAAEANKQLAVDRLLTVGMSPVQLEEIARTRSAAASVKVTSPIDGFVLARNMSAGEKFEAGAELFQIADLRRVWILADVFSTEVDEIRSGANATVTLPGRGKVLMARVTDVLQFDADTSTVKVRLEAENPGYLLRPNMLVDVEVSVKFSETIVVPVDAVRDSGVTKTVFVELGHGMFEPREVATGWQRGERIEIVHGLSAGDRIVTSGAFLLDSESRMRLAAAGMTGPASKDPTCGMTVSTIKAAAAGRASREGGTTYYFCSDDCKLRFDARRTAAREPPHPAGAPHAHHGQTVTP